MTPVLRQASWLCRWLVVTMLALRSLPGTAAAQAIPPDFRIVMTTGGCLGDCASYQAQIDAAGHVRFDGTFANGVTDPGPHAFTIAADEVRALLQRLEQLDFFNLADRYHTGTVTDLQVITFEVTQNGRTKQVFDYDGGPPALNDLAGEVSRLGQASRWIVSDADALRGYLREHPEPPVSVRMRLADKALQFDTLDLLRQVLALGFTPAELEVLAGETDNVDELDALLVAGAPAEGPPGDGRETLLMNAAKRGDLARVDRLLAAGVSVDRVSEYEETALWFAACGFHHEVVARLLAAGANPAVASTLPQFDSDEPLAAVDCPRKWLDAFRQEAEGAPAASAIFLADMARDAGKTTALIRQALLDRASRRRPR